MEVNGALCFGALVIAILKECLLVVIVVCICIIFQIYTYNTIEC